MSDIKKDNYKKRQEDAKKKQSGELPVDVDQDGKMINPHNPDFITKVPWYLGDSGPTLKHHNVQKINHFLSLNESDNLIKNKINKQIENKQNKTILYRKGSCKNCGALTHKEKDCVERPRSSKKSAWKTGVNIAADEVILDLEQHGKISYDAKRDQWQGYDPSDYKVTVERFQRIEAERVKYKQEQKELQKRKEEEEKRLKLEKKQLKQENKLKKLQDREANGNGGNDENDEEDEEKDENGKNDSGESDSGSDYDSDEDDDDDEDTREFLERDENVRDFQARQARQGGVGGAEMKTTVRNLRIREDTPKYLRNLDLNSAFYDPKSRSMRMNPLPNENPENLAYAGDNFVRYTGDAVALAQAQILCWEMQARGEDIDIVSNPSQLELVKKQYVEKKKLLEENKKKELFDKYGVNPESLQQTLDPRLKLGQTESFNEYSHDGRLITTNGVKPIVRTKYEEDVLIGNHLSVWGSYYSRKKSCWGYACCHSTHKNSYCTGEKGKFYNDNDSVTLLSSSNPFEKQETSNQATSTSNSSTNSTDKKSTLTSAHFKRSDLYGEVSNPVDSNQYDEKKVQEAMERLTKNKHHTDEDNNNNNVKKRGYNSMTNVDTTPEELEAYRRIKVQREDPMAKFLSSDSSELLEYEK